MLFTHMHRNLEKLYVIFKTEFCGVVIFADLDIQFENKIAVNLQQLLINAKLTRNNILPVGVLSTHKLYSLTHSEQ